MCVIILSEKGKEAPTEEQIKAAFEKNPDGAGFAYCDPKDHNKVKYEKGFMTVKSLIERLSPLEQWTDTTLAIHFRIGTAGKNDAATCHPFKISTKFKDLRETSGEGPVLFHNGVLDTGGYADPLSSDTQDFVIAMAPLFYKYNKSKTRDSVIKYATEGSRLLVMYDDNKIKMYGDWKKSDTGDLWVSNKYFESSPYTYSTYSYSGYGGYGYYNPYSCQSYWQTKFDEDSKTDDELKEYTKEELKEYWNKLTVNGFLVFDTENLFNQMIKDADSVNGDLVEKDGITFVFDPSEQTAWDIELDDYVVKE